MCTSELSKKTDNDDLEKDLSRFKGAMDKNAVSQGFMTSASPSVIALFMQNNYYQDRETYLWALADLMQKEYETIVDAGFILQLDRPDLALSRHMLFNDLSDDEFVKIAHTQVEALNYALRNIPAQKIRMYICWGNYEGPHCCDIGVDKVFDLFNAKQSQRYSI